MLEGVGGGEGWSGGEDGEGGLGDGAPASEELELSSSLNEGTGRLILDGWERRKVDRASCFPSPKAAVDPPSPLVSSPLDSSPELLDRSLAILARSLSRVVLLGRLLTSGEGDGLLARLGVLAGSVLAVAGAGGLGTEEGACRAMTWLMRSDIAFGRLDDLRKGRCEGEEGQLG